MGSWAQWTAKTALLAVGFAAVACDDAGALLGVVGAACQVGTAVLAPRPTAAAPRRAPAPPLPPR